MAAQIATTTELMDLQNAGALRRLWQTEVGQRAVIRQLDESIAPADRSRLLDLGFTPGTTVEHVLTGLFGGVRAYLVRGAMISLRRDQADMIHVMPQPAVQTA